MELTILLILIVIVIVLNEFGIIGTGLFFGALIGLGFRLLVISIVNEVDNKIDEKFFKKNIFKDDDDIERWKY